MKGTFMKEMMLRNFHSRFPAENAVYIAIHYDDGDSTTGLIVTASLSIERMWDKLYEFLSENGGAKAWKWTGHDNPGEVIIHSKKRLGEADNPYIVVFGRELD
jgi:hypothetical protein